MTPYFVFWITLAAATVVGVAFDCWWWLKSKEQR